MTISTTSPHGNPSRTQDSRQDSRQVVDLRQLQKVACSIDPLSKPRDFSRLADSVLQSDVGKDLSYLSNLSNIINGLRKEYLYYSYKNLEDAGQKIALIEQLDQKAAQCLESFKPKDLVDMEVYFNWAFYLQFKGKLNCQISDNMKQGPNANAQTKIESDCYNGIKFCQNNAESFSELEENVVEYAIIRSGYVANFFGEDNRVLVDKGLIAAPNQFPK
eukprot:SAG25_NODE_3595_length_1028_cov_1.528525_1_plen_218_part_00